MNWYCLSCSCKLLIFWLPFTNTVQRNKKSQILSQRAGNSRNIISDFVQALYVKHKGEKTWLWGVLPPPQFLYSFSISAGIPPADFVPVTYERTNQGMIFDVFLSCLPALFIFWLLKQSSSQIGGLLNKKKFNFTAAKKVASGKFLVSNLLHIILHVGNQSMPGELQQNKYRAFSMATGPNTSVRG